MMDLIFSLGRSEIICANSVNFAVGSSRVWSLTTKVVIFCLSDYFLFSFFRFYLGQYWFGVMFFYVFSEIDKGIIEMQARISL